MQSKHAMMIENFVQRGHSQYFVKKIQGYYIDKSGSLAKAYVKLGNLFQASDDFVLTASILKCSTSRQSILFDGEGRILGVSEEFFRMI